MEQQKQTQQNGKGWFKVILSSVILIALFVMIFYVVGGAGSGKQIEYTQFASDLNRGYIKTITVNANKVELEYFDGKRYWFYNRDTAEHDIISADSGIVFEYNRNVDAGAAGYEGLKKVNLELGSTTTFSILSLLYPIMAIVCMGVLIYIVFKKMGSINNKSFDFVKNRARIIPSNTKFENVAGVDEEKEELQEIIEFLRNPKKYTDIGARIPKGVLLVGQPGTGKTLLAKAIAGEAEVPFFSISGSDFMELFVGVGASRVRDLFENAKRAKPCIIFIDEIDAIGRQRGAGMGGGNDEREQTLNQLLVEMDGFEENEGIIVMAATNRADILDPALMRPGRFDRQIYVHAPDVRGREEILKVHSKNKPLAGDVDLKVVARITSGFTGADLENLLNESAILAARENRKQITMQDINNGIVKVTMGPQKKSRIVSEKDRKITAVHESGHAIIERLVKNSNPVHEVSIVPRGGAGGYTLSRPETDDEYMSRNKLMDTITMYLGGRTAERLFLDDFTTGASNDIERATEIARKMVCAWGMSDAVGNVCLSSTTSLFLGRDYQERVNYSETEAAIIDAEVRKIMTECSNRAEEILSKNRAVLETMVEVLLEKETIYSDEVNMIIAGATAKEVCAVIDKKNSEKATSPAEVSKTDAGTTENIGTTENNGEGSKPQVITVTNKEDLDRALADVNSLIAAAKARKKNLNSNIAIDETDKVDVKKTKNTAAVKAGTENEKSTADSAVAEKKTAKNPTKAHNNIDKNAANNANVNAQGESAPKRRGRPKGSKNEPKN